MKADQHVQEKDKKTLLATKTKDLHEKRRTLWCTFLVFRLSGKMLSFGLDDHHLSNTSFVQGWSRGV